MNICSNKKAIFVIGNAVEINDSQSVLSENTVGLDHWRCFNSERSKISPKASTW